MFELIIDYEPVTLKRHRHRLKGGTYDPSKKDKDEFIKLLENKLPDDVMTKPIACDLKFYCKRPKTHYRTGKKSDELKETAPRYNTSNKDLDNMVKFVLDALNTKLYRDDCQIVKIICEKCYVENNRDGYIYMNFEELN